MWHSLLIGKWNELFYWLPIEELIRSRQQDYYDSFDTIVEILNKCFGKNYKGFQRAFVVLDNKGTAFWAPKFGYNKKETRWKNKKDGEPFLENHHLVWLSRGGTDTIDNTIALCPNCHRKMHILDLQEDIDKLIRIAKGLD